MSEQASIREEIAFYVNTENLPIRAEQIRARLRFLPVIAASQMLVEPLTVGLLWNQAPHTGLLAWLGILLLIHIAELGAWWKYRAATQTVAQCRIWSRVFDIFALAVGALWGVAAVLFFPPDLAFQALFLCVILGLTSGAVTLNPVYPPALYLFLLPILLPTLVRVAYEGDSVHLLVAAMLALYIMVLINSGRQLGRNFFASLRQRFENDSLVAQLTKEKSRAETASKEKSRFLAAASHDLRQPLQALMLFSDAMQEVAQESETKHLAGQIGKSVNALVVMFDELLDVSRLEAGIVEARWQNFELQPLLDRLFVDLAPLAHSKGLCLDMANGDWVVYSDPFLLDRILRNLLSNAIRYTDQGKVALHCELRGDALHVSVTDTGIGIRAEAMPHIFEEYYQVDNQHRDRRKGLGLGLAIVRRVEGLLGCKVGVTSAPGKGSEFSFDIKSGNAQLNMAQPFVITLSRYDLHGVTAALVEDDPDIREMIKEIMLGWGCKVFAGEHAEDVLRKMDVAAQRPDILVCDYRLPNGLTAIHVIQRVRELWGDDVPSLILTGDTGPEALQAIHASGSILLHKPIAPARLRTMMYFALHGEG
ncbi:MAG: hybrid sensor histidine kinase/response regulator [Gallionellaceae bacterium]|jgi:signal transduction histidine kinase